MRKRQATLAVLACIMYPDILTPAMGTFDIIANDINKVIDATLHKGNVSPPATTVPPASTGSVEIFSAGPASDTVIFGSPVLLSAIVLRAGAPALTNTSTQQDYLLYLVTLQGNVVFSANGTVIGNATYTGDPESELLLPAFEVSVDTSSLAPGTYTLSATYEGPDYPPAIYPASIPLNIIPPVVKSLSLTLFNSTGAELQSGRDSVSPTDIIYAVLQLDDDSTEAVAGGIMTLFLTSANDTSFTAYYFADITDSLDSVPIASVVPDMAGSVFTISDFPLGLINISGQYNGSSGIATTPVVTSTVQLVVSSPAAPTAVALEAGTNLQAGTPALPNQILFVLGRAYYLKLINIFDNLPAGKALFNTDVTACLVKLPANRASADTKFLKTSNEFYDYVSAQTSLSAAANTVKVNAEASFSRLQTSRNDRSSYSSTTTSSNNDYSLDFDCISADTNNKYFSNDFLSSLDSLPLDISDPSSGNSWNAYEIFFQKYGSHYVSSLTTGGLINAWATAESSKSYSQSDFAAKACVAAEGPNPLVNQSIAGCAGVSGTSRSASSSFQMNTQVYVRGGSPATQAALAASKGAYSDAIVAKFFTEAKKSEAPIDYKWAPIYGLIQQTFTKNAARYNKGRNLQAYYEGYIAGGCTKEEKNGIVLRQFSLNNNNIKTYQCERACRGCRSNNDCYSHNWWAFSCYCEGKSCVVATPNGDYSTIKEGPNGSSYTDPENASCQYSGNCKCNLADTECRKENKNFIRVGSYYPAQ